MNDLPICKSTHGVYASGRTDRQTGWLLYTPPNYVCRGYNYRPNMVDLGLNVGKKWTWLKYCCTSACHGLNHAYQILSTCVKMFQRYKISKRFILLQLTVILFTYFMVISRLKQIFHCFIEMWHFTLTPPCPESGRNLSVVYPYHCCT